MPREANKDEAIRCKELALASRAAGDILKCIRLLEKSLRLYSDDSVNELLQKIRLEPIQSGPQDHVKSPRSRESRGSFNRMPGEGYTAEQLRGIQKIAKLDSYYDILGIDRAANDDQIKKAYRKLALRYHPDKCGAPGSDEAFKKISKAFQCLSDPTKRRQYDVSGSDSGGTSGSPQPSRWNHDDLFNPQDVFDAFFGMPSTRQRHGGGRHMRSETTELMRLLPILLLFGISILTSLFHQSSSFQAKFSLTPTPEFRLKTGTPILEVPYYAKLDHEGTHPVGSTQRSEFDKRVESIYIRSLYNDCQYEDRMVQQAIQRARRRGVESEIQVALSQSKPNCEKLETLMAKNPTEFKRRLSTWDEF
jgi:DnaJ family protein B protein 12